MLCALEEISWGQRLLGFGTPEVFLRHADQPELNVHNFLQGVFPIKTKHVAGVLVFLFGACLPFVSDRAPLRGAIARLGIVVPPKLLAPSFVLAALMMIDRPTGREEEYGELFFGISLLLFVLHYRSPATRA